MRIVTLFRVTAGSILCACVGTFVLASPSHAASGYPIKADSAPNLCLDADTNTIYHNGTIVQLWTCTGAPNQQWRAGPGGSLINAQSGRCLDADLATIGLNGTRVQLWDCSGAINQRWVMPGFGIDAYWEVDSAYNQDGYQCLDADDGATPSNPNLRILLHNGNKVQLWSCSGQPNQKWEGPDNPR